MEPVAKRQKHAQYTLHVAVPSALATTYITSALVQEIAQYYGAHVYIDPHEFLLLGEPVKRTVITSAGVDYNTLAQQRISQILQHYTNLQSSRADDQISLKILIDDKFSGVVIGKQGATIKELMHLSMGTKIQLCKKEEMPPSMMGIERCITLQGTLEQVSKAQDLLTKKIEDFKEMKSKSSSDNQLVRPSLYHGKASSRQSEPYQTHNFHASGNFPQATPGIGGGSSYEDYGAQHGKINLVIPSSAVGIVVGKQGSNLKAAIEECQSMVRIQQEKQDNAIASQLLGQSMRTIEITGPISLIHKASSLLLTRIQTHVTNRRCSEWTTLFYPQFNPDLQAARLPQQSTYMLPLHPAQSSYTAQASTMQHAHPSMLTPSYQAVPDATPLQPLAGRSSEHNSAREQAREHEGPRTFSSEYTSKIEQGSVVASEENNTVLNQRYDEAPAKSGKRKRTSEDIDESLDDELNSLTVPALKEELRTLDLPIEGTKEDLVTRLRAALETPGNDDNK